MKRSEPGAGKVTTALRSTIEEDAPLAVIESPAGGGRMAFAAQLGKGKLGVSFPEQSSRLDGPFQVAATP